MYRSLYFLLGLFAFSSGEETTHTVLGNSLKTFLDAALPNADLSTDDRDKLAKLFETCEGTQTALSSILEDVVGTTEKCGTIVTSKNTDEVLSASDYGRMKNCTADAKTLIKKHGGLNLLAVPRMEDSHKLTLKHCGDGVATKYADAMTIIVQRYSACNLALTPEITAIFHKVVPTTGTTTQESGNQMVIRNVCNSMTSFESVSNIVTDFTMNTVSSFLDGLHSFSNSA